MSFAPGTSWSRKSFGKADWARKLRTAEGHLSGDEKVNGLNVLRGKLEG